MPHGAVHNSALAFPSGAVEVSISSGGALNTATAKAVASMAGSRVFVGAAAGVAGTLVGCANVGARVAGEGICVDGVTGRNCQAQAERPISCVLHSVKCRADVPIRQGRFPHSQRTPKNTSQQTPLPAHSIKDRAPSCATGLAPRASQDRILQEVRSLANATAYGTSTPAAAKVESTTSTSGRAALQHVYGRP